MQQEASFSNRAESKSAGHNSKQDGNNLEIEGGGNKTEVRKEWTILCRGGDHIMEQVQPELCHPGEAI